jgi:hypothetical protein
MSAEQMKEFMAANLQPFVPVAYFDKHMDCIRVLIQDVSVTEIRLNQYFTVAKPNHQRFSSQHVGFTLKGVAHLFNKLGLPLSGVHTLVEILDEIAKQMPHGVVKSIVEEFSPVLKAKQVSVNFDEEAVMAA